MLQSSNDKIKALQNEMRKHKLDAYLVPSTNEFQNKFAPSWFMRLKFITGFSGSNGTAVITKGQKHYFFTDGRYIEQAPRELGKSFIIINFKDKPLDQWLVEFVKQGNTVGFDDRLHANAYIKALHRKITPKKFVSVQDNLIDRIWHDRPALDHGYIDLHPIKYSGENVSSKKEIITQYLRERKLDGILLHDLTSIAWLLNIRGHSFAFMPCVHSYCFVDVSGKATLFTDSKCRSLKYFHDNHISILSVKSLEGFLKKLGNKRIQLSEQASGCLWRILKNPIAGEDPCLFHKACKNTAELKGARLACLIDSRVVMKCLSWVKANKKPITEMDVSDKLLELRSMEKTFISPSFPSIVAFKENAAMPHYMPSEKSNKKIKGAGLLLIDSGGQYLHGTTDTTRTIALGKPTKEQMHDFTLVLKGHVNLITAVFPSGTSGDQLDALARIYLWKDGKDYDHGTGHGVGSFLCVHEGPQNIVKKFGSFPLHVGMIVSVEPGFYKAGQYGIRIENLACVIQSKKRGYLTFEALTYITIDESLVDFALLNAQEKQWLKQYNQKCKEL